MIPKKPLPSARAFACASATAAFIIAAVIWTRIMRRVVMTMFHVSHDAPRNLTLRALAITPMTSSPPARYRGAGPKGRVTSSREEGLTAAPQLPQNRVDAEIAAPQVPQNLPAGAGAGGTGARAATTVEPQIPQNFSDPLSGLPHEAQT